MVLTNREREIVELVALGKSNPEIGQILGLSEHHIGNTVSRILLKTGATNRTCLAVMWTKSKG